MNTFFIDIYEAPDVARVLGQSIPVKVESLNHGEAHIADYFWFSHDQMPRAASHKQVGEMLNGLDAVEEQLARDYANLGCETGAAQLDLIVEGVIIPHESDRNKAWTLEQYGDRWVRQGKRTGPQRYGIWVEPYDFNYLGYRKKLARFSEAGIQVHEPADRRSFLRLLQALYECDQEEGTTFKRVIRAQRVMPKAPPELLTLMSIYGENGRPVLGEEKARPVWDKYRTVWNVLHADPNEIGELKLSNGKRLGLTTAVNLIKGLGKLE